MTNAAALGSAGTPASTQVAILGGGVVGSCLALALDAAGIRSQLIDAREQSSQHARFAPSSNLQPIALSAGSVRILGRLGVWRHVANATAIETVHVSERGRFGFVRLRADELGVGALGYVVDGAHLVEAVAAACASLAHCEQRRGVSALALQPAHGQLIVHTSDSALRATLAVLADGGTLTAEAGFEPRGRDYGQWALSAILQASAPRPGVAFERFCADGPLALLPWGAARYALVWTLPTERAAAVRALDDDDFAAAVTHAFGRRLGELSQPQSRSAFPLQLQYLERSVGERRVAIGNAAQRLHPVAGQGLNLGLRDVAALAEALIRAHVSGADLGDAALLDRLAKSRRADRRQLVRFTDGLISLFGLSLPGAGYVRGAGLAALGIAGPLRRRLAARAAGLSGRRYRFEGVAS